MVRVICPRCKDRVMLQNTEDPRSFTCAKCGEFVLLPMRPSSEDLSIVWDYLILAGKHIKKLERN